MIRALLLVAALAVASPAHARDAVWTETCEAWSEKIDGSVADAAEAEALIDQTAREMVQTLRATQRGAGAL